MNFFLAIHRSIFDLQFYKDARIFKKGYIIAFFIKQVLLTALIAAVAQVYYLTDPQLGVVEDIEKVFGGMEIKKGVLLPGREMPYVPSLRSASSILEQFMGFPLLLGGTEDSLFIIDTNSHINYSIKVPVVMLKADHMEIVVNKSLIMNAPYSKLLPNVDSIVFNKQAITEYIHRYSLFFFIQFLTPKLFMTVLLLAFSVSFLSIAAYFFRVDRTRPFLQHFKIAFFAVTPITVGSVLTSIAGVKFSWTWHVLIFLSTIVMFRAMLASSTGTSGIRGDDQ
ncbi:MAG TPA: DUF1189 family protein [Chitinispirillaceae bacterium]|nr:DUF1189 family protein [Chitinispirillaceae bacterium]